MYGIKSADYRRLLAEQKGRCAACGEPFDHIADRRNKRKKRGPAITGPCIDHDHRTGRVRAILHHRCNVALGLLKENAVLIRGLLEYAERISQ